MIGMRPALQALFADRMKMAAKLGRRGMPAYALVLARSDGRLGPALKPSTVDCAGRRTPPSAAPVPPAAPGQGPVPCGPRPGGPGRFVFVGSEISLFAGVLSISQRRTVVDRTGLKGPYDFEMTVAPEIPGGAPSDGPSMFTALEEQLGLKLDPENEVVDVLVVETIERPSDN
jgi:uncharacterized protein (TIGR03435 family)